MELSNSKIYSIQEFLDWYETVEGNYELIDGVIYSMASPSIIHEEIVAEVLTQFRNYFKGKVCRAFGSKFGVMINESNYVEPDVTIACDVDFKNTPSIYNGVPELVVEVTSENSIENDFIIKKHKYHNLGIKEYWIIYNDYKVCHVNIRDSKWWKEMIYTSDKNVLTIPVNLPNWDLNIILDYNVF